MKIDNKQQAQKNKHGLFLFTFACTRPYLLRLSTDWCACSLTLYGRAYVYTCVHTDRRTCIHADTQTDVRVYMQTYRRTFTQTQDKSPPREVGGVDDSSPCIPSVTWWDHQWITHLFQWLKYGYARHLTCNDVMTGVIVMLRVHFAPSPNDSLLLVFLFCFSNTLVAMLHLHRLGLNSHQPPSGRAEGREETEERIESEVLWSSEL